MRSHRNAGITSLNLISLAVILVLLVVLICLLLPMLGYTRHTQRRFPNATQARGIQGAMVLFAQGNNGYYPGWNGTNFTFKTPAGWSQGEPDGRDASQRLALMLINGFFTGEYIISPAETKNIWTTGEVTTTHYSYALLQLPNPPPIPAASTALATPTQHTGRLAEWSTSINTLAPVVTDRSKAMDPTLATTSVWVKTTSTSPADWHGTVAWNDNHVSFETNAILAKTKYGKIENTKDDLFTATSESDALMIYGGK